MYSPKAAEWNGLVKSAAIYDQLKQPNSSTAERFCAQARSECSTGKMNFIAK